MPVDFMTKWKGKKQTDTAVAYITNSKNQITSNAEISALETNPEAVYVRRLRDTGVAVTVAKSLCAAVIAPTLRPSNDSRSPVRVGLGRAQGVPVAARRGARVRDRAQARHGGGLGRGRGPGRPRERPEMEHFARMHMGALVGGKNLAAVGRRQGVRCPYT